MTATKSLTKNYGIDHLVEVVCPDCEQLHRVASPVTLEKRHCGCDVSEGDVEDDGDKDTEQGETLFEGVVT